MLSQFFLTLKWKRWKHRTLLSFSDTRGLNTKGMEAERAVNTKYFEGDFLTFSSHWLRVFIQSANVFCFPFLVKVNFSNFPTGRDFLSMILQNGGYIIDEFCLLVPVVVFQEWVEYKLYILNFLYNNCVFRIDVKHWWRYSKKKTLLLTYKVITHLIELTQVLCYLPVTSAYSYIYM